jgi:dimeric dUTPase (all-alpha-NTP-PPase superfamily)
MKTKTKKNHITLSQLYILIQKETGLSTEQIAELYNFSKLLPAV